MAFCVRIAPGMKSLVCSFFILLSCLAPITGFGQDVFQFSTRPLLIPELGEVTSYTIRQATNLYSFLPPPRWQVRSDVAEKRVDLIRPEIGAQMWFRFVASTNSTNQLKPELLRQRIQQLYPGAHIHEEFACVSGLGAGQAFDINRSLTNGPTNQIKLTSRLAYLPAPGYLIEFCLTAPTPRFDRMNFAFGHLLTSFRAESTNTSSP